MNILSRSMLIFCYPVNFSRVPLVGHPAIYQHQFEYSSALLFHFDDMLTPSVGQA